ncbi:HNH endonuclease signature motif containing protein [Lacisediminihabitans sp. FW035]
MSLSTLQQSHGDSIAALTRVLQDADLGTLSDEELLAVTRFGAEERRLVDAAGALAAGEIARRSTPDLGSAGLAQRTGHRTAQELVRVTTGSSYRDAAASVRVGMLVADAVSPAPAQPWLQSLGLAVGAGTLSSAAADAIRLGLGSPSESIPASAVADAAEQLCVEAVTLDVDRLSVRARQVRDQIDEAGIADREQHRRAARRLRLVTQADGMTRLVWIMDPETAAAVTDLYDRATSPRRGGPRFIASTNTNSDDAATAERLVGDDRTTEQLASDTFAELLRHGAAADSSKLLGSGAPIVRILVTADSLTTGTGHGFLEGQTDPIDITTVERSACAGTTQTITLDPAGSPLDVGREHRLYTRRQRIALAARDGGCRFPDCDRPASWCECHHITHWVRDAGRTDRADGILLCRHHHLLIHNNGGEIHRRGTDYWLIPPTIIDSQRTPVRMHSRSRALTELLGKRTG